MPNFTLTRPRKIAVVVFVCLVLGLAASAFTPFGRRVAAHYLPLRSFARLTAPAATSAPVAVPMFATLTVQSLGDGAANAANCPGVNCRLRDAIAAANAGDTIDFAVTGTITLTQGELGINKNLTIQGPGANVLTISGNNASRVFNISSGVTVTIDALTIANGKVSGGFNNLGGGILNQGTLTVTNSTLFGNSVSSSGSSNLGGGILNHGTLTVTNSTLSGNSASGGSGSSNQGGGIFNTGGTLTFTNSTLSGNSVSGNNNLGGGITNDNGTVNLINSTLSGNSASGGSINWGGGISNSGGTLTVTNSTLSGNSVSGGSVNLGGGIFNNAGFTGGTLTFTNSTLSGNSASGGSSNQGGGIFNAAGQASILVELRSSTIANNSASRGGGLDFVQSNGTVTVNLRNTIIAQNTAATSPDVNGALISQGNNLLGNNAGSSGLTDGVNGDKVGGGSNPVLDPLLGPLANNGGPTQTMRPQAGSPAVDMGGNTGAPPTDQRGFGRPFNGTVDIGAVERGAPDVVPVTETMGMITLTVDPATNPTNAALELIAAIEVANSNPAPTTIKLLCGTYSYSTPHNWEYGPNALPIIQSNITIQGNGAVLTSTATTRLRFFYVAGQNVGGLTSGTLTLQDLTLQNGKQKGGDSSSGGGGMGAGGAIFNHGSVTLERVTLNGNSALGGSNGVSGPGQGGGGMGEDALTSGNGGGFGGTPIGAGGSKGTSGGGVSNPFGGGGGGGFRAGDNGTNGVTGGLGGNGGGQGLLGGRGGVLSTTVPGAGGDGGGGGENQPNGGPEFGGAGGDYGFGGLGGNNGSGGGGVGGGGGYGGGSSRYGGGGGFGGGGGRGDSPGSGADGGFGGGGGSNAGASRFAGGNRSGGGAGLGGAIFNHLGTLTLTNCTLTGNTAQGGTSLRDGGSGLGGAVFNLNGTVTVTSSTLAANTVTAGTTSSAPTFSEGQADGGAVYNLAFGNTFTGGATTATVTISNSILANSVGGTNDLVNDKRNGSQTNTATVIFNNGNLVMARTALNSATTTINGSTPLTANPNLGALAVLSNCVAGTCKPAVLPLLTGSPALNAATVDANVTTDQTGTSRGTSPDLGAYENCCTLAKSSWPASLPGGTAGTPYPTQTFAVTGASGTVNWSVTGGTLPNGLMLSSLTGTSITLSGMPTSANSFSFTLNATDSLGCVVSQMYAVTVNCPVIATPMISGNLSFCSNGSTTLTATGSGTFMWFKDNSLIPGQSTNMLTVLEAGSYTVKVTDANSCASATSQPAVVSVKPTPVVNPATPAAICSGAQTNIVLGSTPSGATFSWTASLQSGSVSGFSNSSGGTIAQTLTGNGVVKYTVIATLDGCPSAPVEILQTVKPTPVVTPVSPAAICSGAQTNIVLGSTPSGATFNWTASLHSGSVSGFSNSSGGTIAQTLTGNGVVKYTVTATLNGCPSAPVDILQTVNALTSTAALTARTVCEGAPVTFSTTASGTGPFSFVWKKGATVLTNGGNLTITTNGATSTLALAAAAVADAGSYSVEVTGACNTVTQTAALTVNTLPTISDPTSVNLLQGGTASFSVTPTGTPTPSVQWQVSTDGGTTFADIPNATSTTLALPNVTPAMNGHRYRAIAANTCGTATSRAATLSVSPYGANFTDPLVCLQGGDLVTLTAAITNNGAAAITATFSVTNLAPNLIGIPGSGLASVAPANFVITATSATWNGTLQAGETVTFAFKAQIAPNVAQGTQVCVTSTATLNGGTPVTLTPCTRLACPTAGVAPSLSAQKPGSLLVFPYYTSKLATKADTRFTLSNLGATTAFVHLFFIDGASCQPTDQFLCLTPGASYAGKASETDGETTGWMLAVAVNPQGHPIKANQLIGNAFVNDGEYVDTYGAEAFTAHSSLLAAVQGDTALLFLDGQGYDAVANQLAVEIQSPVNAPQQKVVTVGLRGDLNASTVSGAGQIGTGLLINGNEKPLGSFTSWLNGSCQAIATITAGSPRVPTGVSGMIPSGEHGTLQWRIGGGVGLLLTPRTAQWKGIRPLHKTGLTTATLRIPLFPPHC